MKQELKNQMLEAIFVQTGGRKENPKIAEICAELAVNFITTKSVLAVTSDLKEKNKESEVAVAFAEWLHRNNWYSSFIDENGIVIYRLGHEIHVTSNGIKLFTEFKKEITKLTYK